MAKKLEYEEISSKEQLLEIYKNLANHKIKLNDDILKKYAYDINFWFSDEGLSWYVSKNVDKIKFPINDDLLSELIDDVMEFRTSRLVEAKTHVSELIDKKLND